MSDGRPTPQRIVPDPDGPNADFYRHAATGKLHVQHCRACGAWHHPPRYLCSRCGAEDLEWVPSSGRGTIFSWTVTHIPVDPAWFTSGPYATVVVQMDEGVRIVGAWKGASLDEIHLDLPVVAEIEPVNDRFAFVWFRPA